MTLEGTLERHDVGVGGWTLRTPSGAVVLVGVVPADLAGRRVQVDAVWLDGATASMTAARVAEVVAIRPR